MAITMALGAWVVGVGAGMVTAAQGRASPAVGPPDGVRMLKCCDGTTSPTCECAGPHGGCCSRHHGVCGCE